MISRAGCTSGAGVHVRFVIAEERTLGYEPRVATTHAVVAETLGKRVVVDLELSNLQTYVRKRHTINHTIMCVLLYASVFSVTWLLHNNQTIYTL